MPTRRLTLALCVAALLLGAARPAAARQVRFLGPHPIAARAGGGYCYIESPHLHGYAPDHGSLYQEHDGQLVFTGDPTPFGYDGDKHTFYGHHPVLTVEGGDPIYCFLDGPHFHSFAPPPTPAYKVKDGVAFYVGPWAGSYARQRPYRTRLVNAEYRRYGQLRPTVEVQPPPEWHGEVVVSAPMSMMPEPGASVVVVPPHPPGVVVVPPHPPGVVVVPPHPPGVVVVPPHLSDEPMEAPGRERMKIHHDRGQHDGWSTH